MASIEDPTRRPYLRLRRETAVPYIVMELVEGESLRDRLGRQGKLSLDEALTITRQIALGLEAAAQRGIVHRDIKPSNILLDRAGHVRVADFGLARPVATEDSALTGTGSFVGTPHYVSPEQARGEAVDFRSDMYSLGILLYELLTGDKPFKGSTPVMVVAQHLHESLPSLRGGPTRAAPGRGGPRRADDVEGPSRPARLICGAARDPRCPGRRPGRRHARPRLGRAARLATGGRRRGHARTHRGAGSPGSFAARPEGPDSDPDREAHGTGHGPGAVLSLDGRYLAYLSDGLWVKDLREKTETRMTLPSSGSPDQLNGISPDGSYIYYSLSGQTTTRSFGSRFSVAPRNSLPRAFLASHGTALAFFHTPTGVSVSNVDGTGRSQVSSGDGEPDRRYPRPGRPTGSTCWYSSQGSSQLALRGRSRRRERAEERPTFQGFRRIKSR